jgi:starch synthase
MASPLHVAFVTSEAVPFMKTGGLGDVGAALPKALGRLGHRVTVFLPRYAPIAFPPGAFAGSVHVPVDAVHRSAGFYRRELAPNVEIVFVEHPPFFDRPNAYGAGSRDYEDNRLRFAFLARASIEYFRSRGERPHVFHSHDWQGGLVPVYLKTFYWDDPTLHRMPTVFTIHNLAYQGNFPADTATVLGLPWNIARGDALEFHGGVSYMKAGVLFSELVNTVSPRYASEIQTPEMGYGFDGGILRSRAGDLAGILNGVTTRNGARTSRPAHRAPIHGGGPSRARPTAGRTSCGRSGCRPSLTCDRRHHVAPRQPEGLRRGGERLVRPHAASAAHGRAGHGEPAVQDGFRALARATPSGSRCASPTTSRSRTRSRPERTCS